MCRTGQAQQIVRRCPHSLDLWILSEFQSQVLSFDKLHKFEWSDDMEKDFKDLKTEYGPGKIQAYPDFDSK